MSQKFIKTKNNNEESKVYGKYFAQAVYEKKFIDTDELASYIQQQASVKKTDIKAVLDELGGAMKHYFELGQKVKLDGIGIMKVGFSSIGVAKLEDCTSATITTRRVLFQPETERVVVGQEKKPDGSVKQKYVNAITLLKDVVFEETHDNAMNVEPEGHTETTENTENGNELLTAPQITGQTPFAETTQVSIQGPQGAEIRYTTDGSNPTAESTLYSEAFTLSATATVKAIAILNGESSQVSSKIFTKASSGDDDDYDTGS